jgi:ABC-type antimicrobial peptide transport system permease subunit
VISSLAREHLRQEPLHVCVKLFATALEISILLSWVGIHRGIGPTPSIQRLNFGMFVGWLLMFAFAVSFLFVSIARYSEVLEMAQEIGVLRVLGASGGFLLDVLYQDTLVITVLATIVGIAVTFGVQWFVALFFPGLMTLETAFDWWLIAAVISALGPFVGAALALPRSIKYGVKEALSGE